MLTGAEPELAKFTKCTLTFSGDIQCPHTVSQCPCFSEYDDEFLPCRVEFTEPKYMLTAYIWPGDRFPPDTFLEPGWSVSWDLRPSWRSAVWIDYLPQHLWMLSILLSEKCRGISEFAIRCYAALASTVAQCICNLWWEQFKCTINPWMVTSSCALWGFSGEQLASTFSWFRNEANNFGSAPCSSYTVSFPIQFVNCFSWELSLASPPWVTVLGHKDNIVASFREWTCKTKARVLYSFIVLIPSTALGKL